MLTQIQFQIRFDADVYIMRQRGPFPELMLNQGYRGIEVVYVTDQRAIASVSFPKSLGDFPIESWLVTPDGERSYLFSREPSEVAVEVNHSFGECRLISLPKHFEAPTGLCWFTPDLHMRDYFGRNWALHEGAVREMPPDCVPQPLEMLLQLNDKSQALGVLRMRHDQPGMYVMSDSQIGFVSVDGRVRLLTQRNADDIDIALARDTLFVCSPNEISIVGANMRTSLISARSDERFSGIEIISSHGMDYLMLLAPCQNRSGSTLYFYLL